jgi:hypothetical protein
VPRSAAPARSAPQLHRPAGRTGTRSSGSSRQPRDAPGAPGCFPGRRFAAPPSGRGRGARRLRPGWPSIDGGNEEFPLFEVTSRSSRSSRSRRSLTSAACASICAACAAITMSRSVHPPHPSGGTGNTDM